MHETKELEKLKYLQKSKLLENNSMSVSKLTRMLQEAGVESVNKSTILLTIVKSMQKKTFALTMSYGERLQTYILTVDAPSSTLDLRILQYIS